MVIAPAEVEGAFNEGLGFDGSAIEGLTRTYESDLLAHPDPTTFQTLPWRGEIDPSAPEEAHAPDQWLVHRRLEGRHAVAGLLDREGRVELPSADDHVAVGADGHHELVESARIDARPDGEGVELRVVEDGPEDAPRARVRPELAGARRDDEGGVVRREGDQIADGGRRGLVLRLRPRRSAAAGCEDAGRDEEREGQREERHVTCDVDFAHVTSFEQHLRQAARRIQSAARLAANGAPSARIGAPGRPDHARSATTTFAAATTDLLAET